MRVLTRDIGPAMLIGVALLLVGCNAADETKQRVRHYFEVPAGQEINATTVRAAILTKLPLGSAQQEVYAYLEQRGIGKDGLSSWYPAEDGRIVCRVEYDPKTWDLVKRSFGVFFLLDHGEKLQEIEIQEWLTGS